MQNRRQAFQFLFKIDILLKNLADFPGLRQQKGMVNLLFKDCRSIWISDVISGIKKAQKEKFTSHPVEPLAYVRNPA